MKKKINYLLKNVFLFSISGLIPKILSFLLVPLYTSYLSTNDYGIYDLMVATAYILIPIFTLDIQDAVLIFSMDKKNKKEDVLSISMKINLIGFILVLILISIVYFMNIINISIYFYLFFIIYYLVTALSNSINLFCKGIDKVKTIVRSTIINSVITLSLNVILLVYLKMGIYGYLIANTIGMVISLIYTFIDAKIYKYIKKPNNNKLQKNMIVFSIPLIFSVIAWWINSASDRYILTWLVGISTSGLYAISYKIPSLLTGFQEIFFQAWSISAIKEYDKNDSDGFVGNMYTIMNLLLCSVCSIIIMLNIFLSKILYSGEFFNAWKFVPPLLIAMVFNALSLFIGSIFTAVKDTKTLSKSTIIGAVVNIILNIVLIYKYSAYGAAIATVISYFIVLIMRNIYVTKHISMKTNYVKNYICYILLFIQMFFAYYGNKYIFVEVIILIIIIMVYKDYLINIKKYFKKSKNDK